MKNQDIIDYLSRINGVTAEMSLFVINFIINQISFGGFSELSNFDLDKIRERMLLYNKDEMIGRDDIKDVFFDFAPKFIVQIIIETKLGGEEARKCFLLYKEIGKRLFAKKLN